MAENTPSRICLGSNGFGIAGNRFESFKSCANDVIHFKLVRTESDLRNDSIVFKPEMTHQIFGDSESIFGYKDLRIDIYCTAGRMLTYIGVKYSEKITPQRAEGVAADNVLKMLSEKLQPNFATNINEFTAALAKDATFQPFGELLQSYVVSTAGQTRERKFEIYRCDMSSVGFHDYHERIQPFLLFYVDAASYIDVDDDRWAYYLVYEKYQSGGQSRYAFVGYMTVYNYYAYPERIRPRISQVLVLPPFQRQGHGAKLIQSFYNVCYIRPEVLDITVEDPSENFQRVRDYVDACNCQSLLSYRPESLRLGFSDAMAAEAKEKLKLNRKQARRVYEILRLRSTNCHNDAEFKAYRIDVKKRLNKPFQKNGRDFEKLRRALKPNELTAALSGISQEQRLEYLERQFQSCVNDYRQILDRMALEN